MGFLAENGRILLTDASGNVRLDTANERLFVPTGFASGSTSRPNYSASTFWDGTTQSSHTDTSTVNQDNTIVLANVHSASTIVRGSFKMTTSYGHLINTHWYNASGSYVHDWQGGAFGSPALSCGHLVPCFCAVYTFFVEGGQLKLREQVHLRNEPGYCIPPSFANNNTKTLLGPTFDFKIFVGTFN